MNFSTIDYTVFAAYICFMMGLGIWLSSRDRKDTTQDYFLADKSLPWWAVGGSLIASNISTEQILAMNGSGFLMGMAIATYELMAAVTLLVVAKYFLPVFIEKGVYTMPHFLEKRYDSRVRIGLAFFWVALFVFVNITSVLYLGGLAIENIMGIPLIMGIVGLVIYSAAFSIFGGLKAVVWTDVVQVVVLVFGGLMASYMVVTTLGNGGYIDGLGVLIDKAPEKFDMILDKSSPYYKDLPGISVLIGGMWIANLYYWGNNQYIIQRALAAKDIATAQRGVAFAAVLKIMMPLIVVIPGIAAYVIMQDPTAYGYTGPALVKADSAFPWVLNNYVSTGFKGIVTAALVAAIGSSISSMVNSVSTIFTLDIYQPLFNKQASESHLVKTGKVVATVSLIIGALIAPALGSLETVFQYIQEFTGFISPGVLVVFIFGMFWKRGTANAAFAVVMLAIPLSWAIKFFYPILPFLDRMGFSFLVLSLILVVLSLMDKGEKTQTKNDSKFRWFTIIALLMISVPSGFKILMEDTDVSNIFGMVILALSAVLIGIILKENKADDPKGMDLDQNLFKTDAVFNLATLAICVMLTAIYAVFW